MLYHAARLVKVRFRDSFDSFHQDPTDEYALPLKVHGLIIQLYNIYYHKKIKSSSEKNSD